MTIAFLLCASSISFADALPKNNIPEGDDAAVIQQISNKTSIEVKSNAGSRSVSKGEAIHTGESLATTDETVVLTIRHGNELQIAPNTTVLFEEVASQEEKKDIIFLQQGIVWGIIAGGYTLSDPYYFRTPNIGIGAPVASFILEYAAQNHSSSVATLEGNLKVGATISDTKSIKKSTFVSSLLRCHSSDTSLGKTKLFKRNLLVSYLAKKAKLIAQDMANRGNRVLATLARKQNPIILSDDDIVWNNFPSSPSSVDGKSQLSGEVKIPFSPAAGLTSTPTPQAMAAQQK